MVIIIFTLIILFGFLLSVGIIEKMGILERFGVSYLLGVGLTTLLVFYSSWIGMKITVWHVLILVTSLITLCILICLKFKHKVGLKFPDIKKIYAGLVWSEKLILIFIALILSLSLILTIYYPVNAWDALALYDFRAKIIASLGYFVQIQGNFTYFSQYPLLTSLTHTIIYLLGGNNPQFTYSLYLISFAFIFYSVIRNDAGRFIALLATLFIVTNPEIFQQSIIAYTNLPYTVFYVVGMIYIYKAVTQNKNSYILLSSLLVGLSTWVRADEPFWLTGAIVIIVYSIYKKSLKPILIYFPIFLFIQQPWGVYSSQLFGQAYSTGGQFALAGKSVISGINISRVIDVSIYIYKNVISSWGLISIAFMIAFIVDIKNKLNHNSLIMFFVIIIDLLGLFAGTYIFSLGVADWKDIPDSALRLAMFFPPMMIYYIGLVFATAFNKQKQIL